MCFYCKAKGHRQFDCPNARKKETKASQPTRFPQSSMAANVEPLPPSSEPPGGFTSRKYNLTLKPEVSDDQPEMIPAEETAEQTTMEEELPEQSQEQKQPDEEPENPFSSRRIRTNKNGTTRRCRGTTARRRTLETRRDKHKHKLFP